MKKLLLLSLVVMSAMVSRAQSIGNFESWRNYNVLGKPLTIPTGWNASDSLLTYFGVLLNPNGTYVPQVSKETPGRNGNDNAIKVMSRNQDAIAGVIPAGPMPCLATNGVLGIDQASLAFTFTGGVTHVGMPISASFWVKNNPVNGDSTSVRIMAIDNSDGGDTLVAMVDTVFGSTISNWTQITLPFEVINGTYIPNILRVLINSSENGVADTVSGFLNVNNGTYIIVDDMEITSPAGVMPLSKMDDVASIFPTLTTDGFQVHLKKSGEYSFVLWNSLGQIQYQQELSSSSSYIATALWSSGMYYYGIRNKQQQLIQTGKISKQ